MPRYGKLDTSFLSFGAACSCHTPVLAPGGPAISKLDPKTLSIGQHLFAGGPQPAAPKEGVQIGALCYRVTKARTEVLLVTSRDTGRWVVPKGWPIVGLTAAASATREAFEEAGVRGASSPDAVGTFWYLKRISPELSVPCRVTLFPLRVDRLLRRYPELGQRRRKWFSPAKAAALVDEPELQSLLAGFVAPLPDAPGPTRPKSHKAIADRLKLGA